MLHKLQQIINTKETDMVFRIGSDKLNLKECIENNLSIDSSNVLFDESMQKHTSFKIGGNAECFIKVKTIEELFNILKFSKANNIPLTIIGNGTNLLVKDNGINGIVAKIEIRKIEIKEKNDIIEVTVGAGNTNIQVAQELLKNEITGFEEISGIPGTIGGAIRMNAGAYGKEIKDIVKTVTLMDYDGNIINYSNNEMKFEYRNSILSKEKYIVLEAVFELKRGTENEIKQLMDELQKSRIEKQPLDKPNAGSTFKRGEDFITAKIIDEVGLKGYQIGGAMVSNKHAGFVVNENNATATDVLNLVEYIKKKVKEEKNKDLQLEIIVIGQ